MDESAPGQRRVGVFLLDDHEIVRRGVKDLLESAPDIVVGDAGTAASALARILALKPEMGVSVCRDIRSKMPEVACLMLTSFGDDEALFDAIMAGAAAYVLKQIRASDLIGAARTVASGKSMLDAEAANPGTHRRGLTNRQIGQRLFLAEKTVKSYISASFANLGMERRTQAAAYAARVFHGQEKLTRTSETSDPLHSHAR